MLILTRNIGQNIMIGGNAVTVSVLGVRGCCVSIGIKASKEISILREELYERQKNNPFTTSLKEKRK
jgi:carbon storage regulator CsrA